jgi:hypothetical protein
MDAEALHERLEQIRQLLQNHDIDQATRDQLVTLEIELAETLSLQPVNK